MLAVGDRPHHQLARRFQAADQLDHDIDLWVVDDVERVGCQRQIACKRTGFFEVAHRRADHADFAPGAAGDFGSVATQHGERAAADRSQAQQADVDGFHLSNLSQKNLYPRSARRSAKETLKDQFQEHGFLN